MTPGHGTDRLTTRNDFCNNPCLVFAAPLPPATRSRKDFQPTNRLRDSTTHRVHSKPTGQNQTEDSQIRTSSERWPQDTAYKLTPVNPSHLKTLLEMGLIEMRDDAPLLTNEGHQALD